MRVHYVSNLIWMELPGESKVYGRSAALSGPRTNAGPKAPRYAIKKTLNATAPMSRLVNILLTQYGFAKNSGKYPWHRVRSYRLARL